MDLSPTRTTVSTVIDRPWLGGKTGTDALETATLDITNGGFTLVDGQVPSGTPVKKHAASSLYRRVVTTGGSEEEADGHVFNDITVKAGATKVGCSIFTQGGPVIDAKVPGTFVDLNRSRHIRYV